MSSGSYDVAIVGAGIIGAACAAECAREGLKVIVIERAMIAGGATGACMGHIVVMDDSEAQFALTRFSEMLWHELAPELPRDVEYDSCGTIWVASDEEEMQEVKRKKSYYEARGVSTEILDARALEAAEPNLRQGLVGGLLVSGDAVVYAPCATRFLLEQAMSHGAVLQVGHSVVELTGEGVRLDNGTCFSAGKTINAAGVDSPRLTAAVPVRGRKGHLVVTDRYPGFVRHQLVELGYLKSAHAQNADSVAFNIQPRRTTQMLIGSSRQFGSEDSSVDSQILSRVLNRALEYMPKMARLSAIRAWTGFRPATPDHLPLIGPSPAQQGVHLATGHEGLGVTTSLGTAKLIVDQLLHRPSAIPVEPYLPSRHPQKEDHA
jgi:glycine/D-amino acid oxidase-like deaminating enzyme